MMVGIPCQGMLCETPFVLTQSEDILPGRVPETKEIVSEVLRIQLLSAYLLFIHDSFEALFSSVL
jgi:hypothetical protein